MKKVNIFIIQNFNVKFERILHLVNSIDTHKSLSFILSFKADIFLWEMFQGGITQIGIYQRNKRSNTQISEESYIYLGTDVL